MSVVERRLYTQLSGSTSVTSLAATRIYPVILPQEPKLPAITYDLISAVRESEASRDTGDVHTRIQVTCWAKSYADASDLSEGVRSTVQRWMGSTSVPVQDTYIENEFTFYDDEAGNHAHTLDLIIHHTET